MLEKMAVQEQKIGEMAELGSLLASIMEPALAGGLSEIDADRIIDSIVNVFEGHPHTFGNI